MKKNYIFIRMLFFILISNGLTSISLATEQISKTPPKSVRIKAIGSGTIGGSYHSVTNRLSQTSVRTVERHTGGSVTNIKAVANGEFAAGIAQSDVIEDAFKGKGLFKSSGPVTNLRTIARLYPEYLYLVVQKNSPIQSISDLKGCHVGLGAAGSGTLESTLKVLKAYGLKELDVDGHYTRIGSSIDSFKKGQLDGFFYMTTAPATVLQSLYSEKPFRLIPINGQGRQGLLDHFKAFSPAHIDGNPYGNQEGIETVSVNAELVAQANEDPALIYEMTKSLWESPSSSNEPAPALDITVATNNLSVPLHPGAAQYYRERHALKK